MDIKVLASGSKGNCYVIDDGSSMLLIDAGISVKDINVGTGFRLHAVDGCLISHAHKDHSKSAEKLTKFGVDIYTSQGTIDVCKLSGHRIKRIKKLEKISIGGYEVLPFDVEHDVPEPFGFVIKSNYTGEKLLYFTDTYYVKYRFPGMNYIMAECNYDIEVMKANVETGYIPAFLAKRLFSSHMSIAVLLEFLMANDLSNLRHVYLLHISESNSDIVFFKSEVQKLTGAEVHIC